MDTNPISDDEKQFLYDSVRLPEIRTLIAESCGPKLKGVKLAIYEELNDFYNKRLNHAVQNNIETEGYPILRALMLV